MKKWLCIICGWIYDEALGWPDDGIAPGTRWEDIPEDWLCPECKVGKADFEMIEISEPVTAVKVAPVVAPVEATVVSGPVVIIGSGHAGYGLAQALRKQDPNLEIRVLTRESGHAYSKPALSIALAQGRSAEALASESPMAIEQRLGIRVYPHCHVERIDPQARRLHTNLGEMSYGQLVLASGAVPIRIPVQGAHDALVSVNNLADYQAFRTQLAGVERIAILGDGLIGCEFANDLASSGYQVQVIGLGNWPMERLLPHAAGLHLQQALSALGVSWSLQTTLQHIERGAQGFDLTLANGERHQADLVLSAVGLRPSVELAQAAGVACGRGVQVDEHLQTSVPGIFALGDCIEINGQLLPYLAPINQGIDALARTLLGQPTPVRYPLMPVTVKTPVAPLCLLPAPMDCTGQWRIEPTADGLSAAFHDDSGHLRGFALLGRQAQQQRSALLQTCLPPHSNVA
ncbi:rubredoxin-NAD(+) reductase [Pseudomonas poae]|uniref:Rubredoxin-NAD(+) reductase n=2 Tax=Pseudomonas poae TaxID=200451 RepID=A0A2S9EJB5_9PSED|nr:rubredoxin-NAD(+) reductase [Pseudomonas poae]PRC15397.1 rubredoxin-NAD(+) reductase [Pseudomonas poae]